MYVCSYFSVKWANTLSRQRCIYISPWSTLAPVTMMLLTIKTLKITSLFSPSCVSCSSVGQSMLTLFWSLFGLESLDIIKVNHANHYFTEAVGTILFALYMMFAVVVMLNALIAMMSNTYTRVEVSTQ